MTRDPADYPLLRGQTALLAQALRLRSEEHTSELQSH